MKLIVCFVFGTFLLFPNDSQAGVGIYAGIGVPHMHQVGLTYDFSQSVMLEGSYNRGTSLIECRNFDLRVVQVGLNIFPAEGAFFVGGGFDGTNLIAGHTDSTTQIEFNIKGEALRTYLKLGWIWGRSDEGFWFGIDLSGYKSLFFKKEINALGVDLQSREYRSVSGAVNVFIETNSLNITFARLGWSY